MTMCLHRGGKEVPRMHAAIVADPTSTTETHFPVSHHIVLNQVERCLLEHQWNVTKEKIAINKEGAHLFALYDVAPVDTPITPYNDWGLQIAVRNSHDRAFAAAVAIGARVFVCDNLSISGEIVIGRKHTTHVMRDLPELVANAIGSAKPFIHKQHQQFDTYKATPIQGYDLDTMLMELFRQNVLRSSQLGKVHNLFRYEKHRWNEHGPSLWKLFNAVTAVVKPNSVNGYLKLSARTIPLHSMCDDYAAGTWEGTAREAERLPALTH